MVKVQFAVHLTYSHNDGAPTPFEFNIYVFRELNAENGASFIAAIQSPTILPFQYMGTNSAIHNPTVSNSIGLPGIEQQAGTGKLIQNVNRIPSRWKYDPKCNRTSRGQLLRRRATGINNVALQNNQGTVFLSSEWTN